MEEKQKAIGFIKERFESIVFSLTIVVALITMTGAFMVNRSDLQAINQEMKDFGIADRRDIVNLIIEMKEESKNFNAKLYALEERYIIFMQNKGNK